MVKNECNEDASVIFGVVFDPELEDEMRITIVATGFEKKPGDETRPVNPTIGKKDAAKVETKVEKVVAEPVAEEKMEEKVAEPVQEAPKAAPAKKVSDDFDLDDFFGNMFGKK